MVQLAADMTALTTFRLLTADLELTRQTISRRPEFSREIEHFVANIEAVESLDDLMADQRIYAFVLKAYGLEDMAYAKAFIRKVLEEGVDEPDALANRLADRRYRELAADFNFKRYGAATTTFERTRSGVVERFHQAQLEIEAGEQSDGARLALYFQRMSGEIDSANAILADRALLKFIQTAYDLPVQMSFMPLQKQAALIESKLDLADLKDPLFLDKLVNRFLVSWISPIPKPLLFLHSLPPPAVYRAYPRIFFCCCRN